MGRRPLRVAVVGGGCAAMAAAFELSRPEHRGRFEVTVFQQGWRLGGKGASGRGRADRIEEHGIHLWYGCYENAFGLLRECYAEWDRFERQRRFRSWRDAFTPCDRLGMFERDAAGRWTPWILEMPVNPGMAGDPTPPDLSLRHFFWQLVRCLRTLLESATSNRSGLQAPQSVFRWVDSALRAASLGSIDSLGRLLEALDRMLRSDSRRGPSHLAPLLRSLRRELHRRRLRDPTGRRIWEMVDLVLAFFRGALSEGLLNDPRGFDALEQHDLRAWLRSHGASRQSLDSAFLRGLYDLSFAYRDGNPERPALAAGQALRTICRMFLSYRGPFYWRMNAGMGDVVFTPFYKVLSHRGVRFRFFHRLEDVEISRTEAGVRSASPFVSALRFDLQAQTVDDREYRPLIEVDGLGCWPSEPRWEQLVDGERLRREGRRFEDHWDPRKVGMRTLRVRRDFDFVVLAVGLGAIPTVASQLVRRDRRWRAMVRNVRTVATQAFQVWLDRDLAELGWRDTHPPNLAGFVEPFATWTDMSHLIPEERWPRPPRSIAYFCSPLPTGPIPSRDRSDYAGGQHQRVRRNAVRFLKRHGSTLWPGIQPGSLPRTDSASAAPGGAGRGDRWFDHRFHTANVQPTDRYVTSLPGSSRHRISPLDPTYDNLTVAGDWTQCGFNVGCVESAMLSGRLAAHALSRWPRLEDLWGFDIP